jgi:hypothetical protein
MIEAVLFSTFPLRQLKFVHNTVAFKRIIENRDGFYAKNKGSQSQ